MKRALIVIIILIAAGTGVWWTAERGILSRIASFIPRQKTPLVFAVIGDTESHNDLYEKALSEAQSRGATFVVHTGDLTADGTEEQFRSVRKLEDRIGLPVTVAVGNHDRATDPTGALFEQYVHPETTVFERGGIRFVVLDNAERKVGFSDTTLAALKKEFTAYPLTKHILVYHRPFNLPFSALTGDDETAASRATNDAFLSLLPDAPVLAIFNGHVHAYLPYTLNDIRAYVTGGGGGETQQAVSLLASTTPHFLLVTVTDGNLQTELVPIH